MTNDKAPKNAHALEDPAPTNVPGLKRVFVVSPIGAANSSVRDHADLVLEFIINAGLTPEEWEVTRADAHESPDSITKAMMEAISNADLVVALLSGHNPNVFYELAVAHCWEKPVVCLIKHDDVVPFDVKDTRMVAYDLTDPRSVKAAAQLIRTYADTAVSSVQTPTSPVTPFLAKHKTPMPAPSKPTGTTQNPPSSEARIISMLEDLSSRIAGLESRMISDSSQRARTLNDASRRAKTTEVLSSLGTVKISDLNSSSIRRAAAYSSEEIASLLASIKANDDGIAKPPGNLATN